MNYYERQERRDSWDVVNYVGFEGCQTRCKGFRANNRWLAYVTCGQLSVFRIGNQVRVLTSTIWCMWRTYKVRSLPIFCNMAHVNVDTRANSTNSHGRPVVSSANMARKVRRCPWQMATNRWNILIWPDALGPDLWISDQNKGTFHPLPFMRGQTILGKKKHLVKETLTMIDILIKPYDSPRTLLPWWDFRGATPISNSPKRIYVVGSLI